MANPFTTEFQNNGTGSTTQNTESRLIKRISRLQQQFLLTAVQYPIVQQGFGFQPLFPVIGELQDLGKRRIGETGRREFIKRCLRQEIGSIPAVAMCREREIRISSLDRLYKHVVQITVKQAYATASYRIGRKQQSFQRIIVVMGRPLVDPSVGILVFAK